MPMSACELHAALDPDYELAVGYGREAFSPAVDETFYLQFLQIVSFRFNASSS
ncbi:hypothetical protein ABID58_001212 [Bradyrhizobium sp. S3.2.6]|uniref:hypothetical protein n=1 Tax=Bradyrhizobium sp. S3.2.6 TaxID=3156428 RepID=UPI003392C3E9